MGVNATPAFFINGRFLSGAQPFEAFRAIIDEEIGN
jgi:protein-disulfide isomerase